MIFTIVILHFPSLYHKKKNIICLIFALISFDKKKNLVDNNNNVVKLLNFPYCNLNKYQAARLKIKKKTTMIFEKKKVFSPSCCCHWPWNIPIQ